MIADLIQLSKLLKDSNEINRQITHIIGRPAQIGHIDEFIASQIFNIELEESASRKAIDGHFRGGNLAGNSVNIKWYAKLERILDITPKTLPDFYLVLAGPTSSAGSSKGVVRLWVIDYVYLLRSEELVEKLKSRRVKIGVATSVAKQYWDNAEVYPNQHNFALEIDDRIKEILAIFGSTMPYDQWGGS